MPGVYSADGGFNVTVVGENDLPIGLYAANGSFRVTEDAGPGVYAPNGAYRIGSSGDGAYTPSGALNGLLVGSVFYPAYMEYPFFPPSSIIAEAGTGVGGAGQWRPSNSGTQTMTIDSTFVRRTGHPTLKIDASVLSPTGAYFRTFRKAISTIALTGPYEMWVWVPVTSAGGHSFIVKTGSDTPADPPTATPANRVEQTFTNDKFQSGYWTCLYWHTSGKLYTNASPNGVAPVTTGSPNLSSLKEIEFDWSINTATPALERYMYLDVVAFNGQSRPKIMFGFDGFGDASHLSLVLPKFNEHGLKGYIAGDGDSVAGNEAKLDTFYAADWNIISQGIGHTNYGTSPQLLSDHFDQAKAILQTNGYTNALNTFAYPFNTRTLATDATLYDKGVTWARTTGGNRYPITSLGHPNPLLIGGLDIGQKTSAQVQAWVDDAILSGYSLVLYGHTIATTASVATETATAEFNTMVDYIATKHAAGLIEVVTPTQFV